MNAKQRAIRAGIRQAKRIGTAFQMVELKSCNEPKVVDEKKVKEKIAAEQAKPHPDKRKLRRLKASIA